MIFSRRAFLFALAVSAVGAGSRLAQADLWDDYNNSVSKSPFVSFLARKSPGDSGLPGHSFVGIGVELDNGLLVYERLLGFYPENDQDLKEFKGVFNGTSGNLMTKWDDLVWAVEYRKNLDLATYEKAVAVAQKWADDDQKYSLLGFGGKNCSNFAAEVAKAAGLKVPSGAATKFPITFMTELKAMNTEPQ